jgi:membrane protein
MQINKALDWLRQRMENHVLRPLKRAAVTWYASRTFELGAALAYYAIFAIAPMILVTIAVASLLFGKQAAQGQVLKQIEGAVGTTVARAIADTLQFAYHSGSGVWATGIGTLVFFFAVTGLFSQLQSALNAIWQVEPKPGRGVWGVVKDRFWSFVAVIGLGALLLAAVLVHAWVSVLSAWSGSSMSGIGWVGRGFHSLLAWVLVTLGLTLIFQVLPDVEIAWRDVWVGAAVSALLFILGNWLFSLYLSWSGMMTAYGAAGSLVVLLLWVYYSAQVLLFGAEFTQAYARRIGKPIRPSANAEAARSYPRRNRRG